MIKKRIQKKILILDGATGTELQAQGMSMGVSPEIFGMENPKALHAVHRGYLDAGSDIIYTCTFGANRFKLAEYGTLDVHEVNRKLATIARQAAGKKGLVAGDIGPTGRFVEPFGDLDFEEAVECFKEQARGLREGGVDLFVIETMIDIQEARAALIAIKEISDLFTMVTMTFESSGRTLNGTDPVSALITLQALGADAVGCNCSAGPKEMVPLIRAMKPYATVPLVAKPNAGLPRLKDGTTYFEMGPSEFSEFALPLVDAGVNLIGGCCGTTSEHIKELKGKVSGLSPAPAVRRSLSALSSHARAVILDKGGPIVVIGERINPTGKKDLQKELLDGKMSMVGSFARDQVKNGASVLDVNVGMPGIDETATMRNALKQLSISTDVPLCIDTTRIESLEAALRIYPGRALINSISGEEATLEKRLNLAAFYGAMFILLPLSGNRVPKTSQERKEIVSKVFEKAEQYGFSKDDIVVDALTMAVSADGEAGMETLKTVRWCSEQLGTHTVLGLSNVSFGLPERKWINAAFLAMAASHGLSLAIANPSSEEFMNMKRASDVLTGRDKLAGAFIGHFSASPAGGPDTKAMPADRTVEERIHDAIMEGDRDGIMTLLHDASVQEVNPRMLVDEIMIPAIRKVGELYERKSYFLPQLIASAETIKKAFEHLKSRMKVDGTPDLHKGRIILATVNGDIHDIGKNIVSLMLANSGFDVVDLGKDVSPEVLIEAIRQHRPDIVGLSALMTTTMVNMQESIERIRDAGVSCEFMVGGAVVTEEYARSLGVRYGKDGVEAVRVAEELVKSKQKAS
jgi:5-methyltetrahydrofolate--homocysteine methyltransferase